MKSYMRLSFRRYFGDGDGGGTGAGAAGGGTGAGAAGGGTGAGGTGAGAGGTGTPPAKTFTQDEVNAFVAEERRKVENKNKETIAQLEALKAAQGLSEQQKQELQAQIDSMQQQYMSKEELAKQEREKEMNKFKSEAEKEKAEALKWKNDYTKLSIDNAIMSAATEHGAYSNEQMITFLTPMTELTTEVGEDGKPTGKFIPMVNLDDKDKDGKPIVLKLSVSDAVKRMKEIPERFGNLFKGEGTGGIGSINRPSGTNGATGNDEYREDFTPEQFREWRKRQPYAKRPGVIRK